MVRIGLGLAFVALFASVGIVVFHRDQDFRTTAQATVGTVYKNRVEGEGDGQVVRPVVRYVDNNGQVQTFTAPAQSHLHEQGEKVSVLFDPKNPTEARIDTTMGRFGVPVLCGLAAFLSLLFFVFPRRAK